MTSATLDSDRLFHMMELMKSRTDDDQCHLGQCQAVPLDGVNEARTDDDQCHLGQCSYLVQSHPNSTIRAS